MTSFRRWLFAFLILSCAGFLSAAAGESESGHDLEIDPPLTVGRLETATTVHLQIQLHNRGRSPWSAEAGFALSYHWVSTAGEIVIWDGLRSPLTDPIAPGEQTSIDAVVRTPDRAGVYGLQWDLVQEGVLWVSEVDPTPVETQWLTVEPTHAFSLSRVTTPRVLRAGEGRRATVEVRNDGTREWSGDGSVSLAYHWFDADGAVVDWEGRRFALTSPVAPGETLVLETVVEAPSRVGRVWLQWDMVDDGLCWFSERDASEEPRVTIVVIPSSMVNPVVWSLIVTTVAAMVVGGGRRRLTGVLAVADVVWCVAAIILKQSWVLGGMGLHFSASGLLLSCASAAAVGLVLLALPGRIRPWVSWMVVGLVTVVLFADIVYERFFGDLLSFAALQSAGQIGSVEASIRSLLLAGDLWFWADLPAAMVLVWAISRSRAESVRRVRILAGAAAVVVVLAAGGAVAVDGATASFRQVFNTTHLARQIGVLNLHTMDLGRGLVRSAGRPDLTENEYLAVVDFFDDRRSSRAGSGPFFGAARGRNLLMIQVESLQAFVIGFEVGGREVTPFLNALAEENFWFTDVADQTEEGRSSDSELATQVSLLPPDRGAAAFLHAGNDYTGLASVLDEFGYATLSAVPFDGSFWNRRSTHSAYGYAQSLFVEDFDPGEQIGWGLNDLDFLSQAVARVAGLPEPWCAFLLTLSLHHPFDGFPAHLKRFDVGGLEGTPFGNYLHTMHHFDIALRNFVNELERTGLLERTVLALWGDHDAGFEWRVELAAALGTTHDTAGWFLSQKVPLVIRIPNVNAPADGLHLPAGHTDVTPTLLAIMGVDPASFAFTGRNLLGTPGSEPVVGEYRCWNDRTHLYLRRGPQLSDGECISLASMREVSSKECAAGFEQARRQVQISSLVLEHDLQKKLGKSLAQRP